MLMTDISKAYAHIIALIEDKQQQSITSFFLQLHPGIQADVFELLNENIQQDLLSNLAPNEIGDIFNILDDPDTLLAANLLSNNRLTTVVAIMEPDEAADLLKDLPTTVANIILDKLPPDLDVHQLIKYPDNTAGGRMTTNFYDIRESLTVGEVLTAIQIYKEDIEVPYYLFVTDAKRKLTGVLNLKDLVINHSDELVSSICDSEVVSINDWDDQEKVAHIIQQYGISALPVTNRQNQLLGIITHDDILDVVQEEATEDLYRFANVSKFDINPDSPVRQQLKGRLPWLFLNTLTALFASWVISNFEDVLAQVATLAVFQSVVAGQGGNAASQSVALFVRAIATGNFPTNRYKRYLWKQFRVGLIQGLVIGTTVGIGVYFWQNNIYLGMVIGISLLLNIILAGIVGTLTPLGLQKIGLDPALASTVLVTAATDSIGFYIFLSIAKYFLPEIMKL
jgi:magnesium transporter